ncbi:MAG: glycosyltransferase [Brachybacterium sp.]|nr:glycosyltransferase [Brachybacterium sp.]
MVSIRTRLPATPLDRLRILPGRVLAALGAYTSTVRTAPRHAQRTDDAPLRVLIPRGMARLATQSGIGEAIRHQERTVRSLGHTVVRSPLRPFDVVHLNTPFPDSPLIATWARLRRRPVLVWAHSTEEDFRDSFTGANRLAPWFRRWIAAIYRQGDAVITPTAYSRSLIIRPAYGIRRNIHVLSNGVDTDFFRPDPTARGRLRRSLRLRKEAPVVMSVGIQMVRKGILDWVELARRMPEVTFLWYGRTDPRLITAQVARAVAAAPPNCRFPGYVRPEVLRDAYAGADAFCFLTQEETEGIVLLEALACGTPVVVRDIPIYHDWLPDGQATHLVAGRAEAFVAGVENRLRRLLGGDLPDLTTAGRLAAEEVDLRRVAERLAEIYRIEGVRRR